MSFTLPPMERYFTGEIFKAGKNPYTAINWETRTASLTNAAGETIFEQKDVSVPSFWSMTATNIVASKYFYGKKGSSVRENDVFQLISRVTGMISSRGQEMGYFDAENAKIFADELSYLLLNQRVAFNSPVWFNVGNASYEPNAKAASWHWDPEIGTVYEKTGYNHPQCSACFINSVDDSMDGIMELARTEALLFKFGSGTGTNFSTLRSSKEDVSGGGTASGPLSFMRGLDAFAGVIKSGGKTRRAAKMAVLNIGHPDIVEFINCKLVEDQKAQALMREGYDGSSGPDSAAYASVFYQNANNSISVTDEFMQAVMDDGEFSTRKVTDGTVVETFRARDLLTKIAEATWACGDPGLQYTDTMNRWHTSKASGRINASNPCSEYLFLDDSACNLASFNLLKFLDKDGEFDMQAFQQATYLLIVAQDILVDMSGYPTEKIARNSHDFRPLGLGYANLGALLMHKGMAYDSDAGREYAAAITSLMTGAAYLASVNMAQHLDPLRASNSELANSHFAGVFPGFVQNEASFLEVMRLHRSKAVKLQKNITFANSEAHRIASQAAGIWGQVVSQSQVYGARNAQVTVLAPTGTIGFMMDCDTTGVEPELALIRYKKMVGGGYMQLVNEGVGSALRNLGYSETDIDSIVAYVNEKGTIEGAPGLQEDHLSIFDTSFKPTNGTRFIDYSGHIRMMAAVQPFLSGAISKTVNMPKEATVEDIFKVYVDSWFLGIKAVAIYRDSSKSNQVLVTSKDEDSKKEETVQDILNELKVQAVPVVDDMDAPPIAVRHRLPDKRAAITYKFSVGGHEGYITVGLYKSGAPGEIFITMAKEGSTISGVMDAFATVFSIALQHGAPLSTFVSKLSHMRFEPSGWTGNQEIGYAKSIMDYLARLLDREFLQPKPVVEVPPGVTTEVVNKVARLMEVSAQYRAPLTAAQGLSRLMEVSDSPACPDCGAITVRSGSCYKCLECGSTTGCS